MENHSPFTLINLQNGNLAFKLLSFEDGNYFQHVQRNNYYSLIWITAGSGKVKADFAEYDFGENNIFAFSPYQPFMFSAERIKGTALYFHPDFFCIHKHQTEAPCLFNNIYQLPYTFVNEASTTLLSFLIGQMKAELEKAALDQHEMLVAYLKIFLITISRQKTEQQSQVMALGAGIETPFILQILIDTIEKDFRKKHSASDYAKALNISTKALAKITKVNLNKTLTEMISERIIIEAKRELYLTRKAVKEIAYELGYEDEHYFSRFFKINTDISPQIYRETVGFGRGEA
jgi:AraC family transcriptional regulator, transcriptional activator of pobA